MCRERKEGGRVFLLLPPNLPVLGEGERDTTGLWIGGAETQLFPTDQPVMILERSLHLLCIYRSLEWEKVKATGSRRE